MQPLAAMEDAGSATVLKFGRMTSVDGPYVGPANPIRGVLGGGLPWVLTAAAGSLSRDGHLVVKVRGLVLANQPAVPGQAPRHESVPCLPCRR